MERAANCWSLNVRPRLNPRRRCVGFVVDEVVLEQVILQAFQCSCVIVIPPGSVMVIHSHSTHSAGRNLGTSQRP